jgi:hypothetical protein
MLLNKQLRLRGAERFRSPAGIGLALAAFVGLPLMLLLPLRHEISGFYSSLGMPSATMILIVATLAFGAVAVGMTVRAGFVSRLEFDEVGIRFRSGWPGWIGAQLDWTVRWRAIERIEAVGGLQHPLHRPIRIHTADHSVRVVPWIWVDPADAADLAATNDVFLREHGSSGRRIDVRTLERMWSQASVLRLLAERGHPCASASSAAAPTDVQSSPQAMALACGMVACIAYAVAEIYFLLSEYYAGAPPHAAFAILGAIGAAAAWGSFAPGLRRTAEARVIAVLFGFGVALASYPMLLRVNAWTDRGGLQPYEYELGADDRWTPVSSGTPTLTFDFGSGYWRQFAPGARKTFHLRRGGLGFHQVDMSTIYDEQKAFYRKAG